jgi:nucleoside-diphosphate-sugar epimerase
MTEIFIAGCGDVGGRIAQLCRARGLAVTGLVASAAGVARLREAGIAALQADLDAAPPVLPPLAPAVVFYLVPPPKQGEGDPRLEHFLAALPAARAFVYLSTSAVYGDCGGAWVDESAPLNPGTARGRRRLAAERLALAWGERQNLPVMILRVPGIYGPGRLPRARLEKGLPVLCAADSPWTNRIHADDLAAAALCVAERGAPGAAYNVSDGEPTAMADYFNRCADRLGLPRPPPVSRAEAQAQLTPEMLSFLEESRRLDTRRLRALGWAPRYPSLAEGLPASL